MPNRYFQPAEFTPLNTYSPLPFEDLLQVGLLKQKRADENLGFLKPQGLSSIEEHDPYRNSYLQSYNQKSKELIAKGIDPASKQFREEAMKTAYQFANNPNLQVLKRSEEEKKNWRESVDVLNKQGNYAYWRDPQYLKQKQFEAYKQGLATNPYLDESGNPVEFSSKTAQAAEDWNKPVTDLFDKVKADGKLKDIEEIDPTTGNVIGIKKGYEGIAAKKIDDLAINNVPAFLNTAGGRDFIDKLKFDNPDISKNELIRAAHEHISRVGKNYIYGKVNEGSDVQYGPQDVREALGRTVTHTNTPVQALTMSGQEVPELEFDKNGNVGDRSKGILDLSRVTYAKNGSDYNPENNLTKNYNSDSEQWKDERKMEEAGYYILNRDRGTYNKQEDEKFVKDIQAKFPTLSKLKPKEAFASYKEAIKDYKQRTLQDINPSGEWKKSTVEDLTADFTTRGATLIGGNPNINTFEGDGGIMDQLGYSPESESDRKQFTEAIKSVKIQPLGTNYAGAFVVQVPSKKDGITRRIEIEPDDAQKQAFLRSNTLSKMLESSILNPTLNVQPILLNGLNYKPIADISNKTGKIETKIEISDAQGNILGYRTLDDVYASDEKLYIGNKEKFLGSNLPTNKAKDK